MTIKICSKCHNEYPLEDFIKDKSNKSGYGAFCKRCRNKYAKEWRKKCGEELREYKRQWNKDNYSDKHRENVKRKNRATRIKALTYYGNGKLACVKCGESRFACLSIDHINGGGNKSRHENPSSNNIGRWLKTRGFPSGYQTLCMNCQWVKRIENHEDLSRF